MNGYYMLFLIHTLWLFHFGTPWSMIQVGDLPSDKEPWLSRRETNPEGTSSTLRGLC